MRVKGIMTMVIRTAKIVIVGFLVIGMVYSMTNGMVKDYLEDTMGAVVSKAEETSNEFTALAKIHYGEAYICTDGDRITKFYVYRDGRGLVEEYENGVKDGDDILEKGYFQYKVEDDNVVYLYAENEIIGQFSKDGTRLKLFDTEVYILEEEIPKMFENIHWGEAYIITGLAEYGYYYKEYYYEDGSVKNEIYDMKTGECKFKDLFVSKAGSHKYEIQADGLVHMKYISGDINMYVSFSEDGTKVHMAENNIRGCLEKFYKTELNDVLGKTYVYQDDYIKYEFIIEKNKITARYYESGEFVDEVIMNEESFTISEKKGWLNFNDVEYDTSGFFVNKGSEFYYEDMCFKATN